MPEQSVKIFYRYAVINFAVICKKCLYEEKIISVKVKLLREKRNNFVLRAMSKV